MDRSYAKILAWSATNSLSLLANALPDIKEGCGVEEYNKIRRKIASILADIITEILNPIFDEHVGLEGEIDAELGHQPKLEG